MASLSTSDAERYRKVILSSPFISHVTLERVPDRKIITEMVDGIMTYHDGDIPMHNLSSMFKKLAHQNESVRAAVQRLAGGRGLTIGFGANYHELFKPVEWWGLASMDGIDHSVLDVVAMAGALDGWIPVTNPVERSKYHLYQIESDELGATFPRGYFSFIYGAGVHLNGPESIRPIIDSLKPGGFLALHRTALVHPEMTGVLESSGRIYKDGGSLLLVFHKNGIL